MTIWLLDIEDQHVAFGGSTSYPCISEERAKQAAKDYILEQIESNHRIRNDHKEFIREAIQENDIRAAMYRFESAVELDYSGYEYGGRFNMEIQPVDVLE